MFNTLLYHPKIPCSSITIPIQIPSDQIIKYHSPTENQVPPQLTTPINLKHGSDASNLVTALEPLALQPHKEVAVQRHDLLDPDSTLVLVVVCGEMRKVRNNQKQSKKFRYTRYRESVETKEWTETYQMTAIMIKKIQKRQTHRHK